MGCGCNKKTGSKSKLSNIKDLVIASEDDYRAKINTCLECEHIKRKRMRCGKCGCFLRIKARLRGFSCPLGKW